MKILFIGSGNMGQAVIGGIIKKKVCKPARVSIYEINEETRQKTVQRYGVRVLEKPDKSVKGFDIIVLAVKPQAFAGFAGDEIMKGLPALVNKNQSIVSVMAGITISRLSDFFGKDMPIFRVMPNTPSVIGKGMSVISCSPNADEKKLLPVKKIFLSIGKAEIMEEKHLDAVTALSGSGPAYVFYFIEALTEAGAGCGLDRRKAEELAVNTVIGAASMINNENPPEELRRRVTSPGGTTMEAIKVFEQKGFKEIVIEAVKKAEARSKELSACDK